MPTSLGTRFLPSRHGFHFSNDFRNVVVDGVFSTWGLCNGMSWLALDFFNAGRPIPATTSMDYATPIRTGVGAASRDSVTQILAFREGQGVLHFTGKANTGSGFGDWGLCSGLTGQSNPAITSWGPNRSDVLFRGSDNKLYHAWLDGRPFAGDRKSCGNSFASSFEFMGGSTLFHPAIASPFANRLELYHVDNEGNLQFRYYDGTWHDWVNMGAPAGFKLNSGVAAVSRRGYMSAFARGANNSLWQRRWEGGGWQPWTNIGGVFTSGPAAVSPYEGRTEVYGRGTDGAIWINIQERGAWNGWASLGSPPGGCTTDSPAAIGRWGSMDVFVLGNDRRLWHREWANGWQPWQALELPLSDQVHRLKDAIYGKNMSSTVSPLIAALATIPLTLGIGLAALGTVKNYITWRTPSDDDNFRWSSTDELRKLVGFLQRGTPVPLGLMLFDGWGHEVVAYGIESSATLPSTGSFNFPGGTAWHIKVYDPNHPDCDNNVITIDPNSTITHMGHRCRIFSNTGEHWRGCFVRDDYRASPPPAL